MTEPDKAPRWVRWLHWIFCLSMAFDFKGATAAGESGGSAAQALMILIALGSGSLQVVLGWRFLFVRPVAWLIALWGGYIAWQAVNTISQGVPPGNFVRVILPYALVALAMAQAHVAACRGMTAWELLFPLVLGASCNIVWRIVHGFAFKGITLETARYEIQSPASNYLSAFLWSALWLRPKFKWQMLLPGVCLMTGILISVTRALLIPLALGGLLGFGCLLLGVKWRVFAPAQIGRKLGLMGAVAAGFVVLVAVVGIVQPVIIERWTVRLFQSGGSGDVTSKDLSLLSREAEAVAMLNMLKEEPLRFIHGHGFGAPWYWDPSYYPEMYLVYPLDTDFATPYWFCGHSVWTYSLFSGGVVGVIFHLILFGGMVTLALRAVRSQSGQPHPDAWLGFMPGLSILCLLSESLTSNAFDERLMGICQGTTAGMVTALFIHGWRVRRQAVATPHAAAASHPHAPPLYAA